MSNFLSDFKKTISKILETKLGLAEKLEELKRSLNDTISKIILLKQRKAKPFSIDSGRIKEQHALKGVQFSLFNNIVLQELDQQKKSFTLQKTEFPPADKSLLDDDSKSIIKKPFSGRFTTYLYIENGKEQLKLILNKTEAVGYLIKKKLSIFFILLLNII